VLVGKLSFFPFVVFNFILILIKSFNQKKLLIYIFLIFIILIIFLFPRIYILEKVFNQPFLPIILFNDYSQELLTFKSYLINYDRPLNLTNLILTPINLIIPFKTEDIFKIFGVSGMLFYFISLKKNKIITYFIIFNLIGIILIGNLQLRWFLPIIILGTLFAKSTLINNLYFKKIVNIQAFFVSIVLSFFASTSILSNFSDAYREKFFNYFISELKVIENLNSKILISDIQYDYYIKNYIPLYDFEFEKLDLSSYISKKTKNYPKNSKYIFISKNLNYRDSLLKSELFIIEDFYQKKHKIHHRNLINFNIINYHYILFSIKQNK
jgi:hypothetical protein